MTVDLEIGTMTSTAVSYGVEIIETKALRRNFAPHRHDCYVVGITNQGAQRFGYRGEERCALPGEAFVLHPDEKHDGKPGTDDGYGYTAAYISPEVIADAVGGRGLPFVREAVSRNPALLKAIRNLLDTPPNRCGGFDLVASLAALTDAFLALSGLQSKKVSDQYLAMSRIKDHLRSEWHMGVSMSDLEAQHNLDRYTIARQFRRHFGVSPHRYIVLRRLDNAKRLILTGRSFADAAYASGFSDQSHMARHFLRSFGLPPGRWRRYHKEGQ